MQGFVALPAAPETVASGHIGSGERIVEGGAILWKWPVAPLKATVEALLMSDDS